MSQPPRKATIFYLNYTTNVVLFQQYLSKMRHSILNLDKLRLESKFLMQSQ